MTQPTILELGIYFYGCPLVWQKFVLHYRKTGEEDVIQNVLLLKYNAIYRHGNQTIANDYVIFPDEQTKFEFILEWS